MADKRFGGFWRRLWAFCIDQVLLYLVSLILYLIGLLALGLGHVSFGGASALGGLSGEMSLFKAIYLGATVITAMAYFTWFHGIFGQTPGKMLLGLKVIQVSGDRMTLGAAFLRWVGTLVSGLVLGLGYLWVAFDGRKQGWHDKIAATLVIRTGNKYAAATDPVMLMAVSAMPAASAATPITPPADREDLQSTAAAMPLSASADGETTPAAPSPTSLPEGEFPGETRSSGDARLL